MPTWYELEQRFKELESALQYSRIDGQSGAAGEHWRLAGTAGPDIDQRFKTLAQIAGDKFISDFPDEAKRFPEITDEKNAAIRWYKALKCIAYRYEMDTYAEQRNADGSSAGLIFLGTIQKPASASATLCLSLAARVPTHQSRATSPRQSKIKLAATWVVTHVMQIVIGVVVAVIST